MGNAATSHFADALAEGHQDVAAQLDAELNLNPCVALHAPDEDTPLHLAARSGMDGLVLLWLTRTVVDDVAVRIDVGKTNALGRSILHASCVGEPPALMPGQTAWQLVFREEDVDVKAMSSSGDPLDEAEHVDWEPRKRCIEALLRHESCNAEVVNALDNEGATALHLACRSGLPHAVALLLSAGALTSAVNAAKQLSMDETQRADMRIIADQLEARAIFASVGDATLPTPCSASVGSVAKGLTLADVRTERDGVMVETASMLGCPIECVEPILRVFQWDRMQALDAYLADRHAVCARAGVAYSPPSASGSSGEFSSALPSAESLDDDDDDERVCGICAEDDCLLCTSGSCAHRFCEDCWKQHLSISIASGGDAVSRLGCPHLDCTQRVSAAFVERMVDAATARKFHRFDLNSYVESNPRLKWCPHRGCGRAVVIDASHPDVQALRERLQPPPLSSPLEGIVRRLRPSRSTVQCGVGHLFCYVCSGSAHDPLSCVLFKKWDTLVFEKTGSHAEQIGDRGSAATELWMKSHTKPCPKCGANIQKNQGCAHMTCRACRYQFCWLCMRNWAMHSSKTGGFYACNRVEGNATARVAAEEKKNEVAQTQERILIFYFERFNAHEYSRLLELRLVASLADRRAALEAAMRTSAHVLLGDVVGDTTRATDTVYRRGTDFLLTGLEELLTCRMLLRNSYAFAWFMKSAGAGESLSIEHPRSGVQY